MRTRLLIALCLAAASPVAAVAQVSLADLPRLARERADRSRPQQVEALNPFLADLGEPPVRYERITVAQLAALAAASDFVLRF